MNIAAQHLTGTKTVIKTPRELKAGDVVEAHGALFVVEVDARESTGHRPPFNAAGPSDTAFAFGRCIVGEVRGYFSPGSSWTFQGNQLARCVVRVA